MTVKINIEDIDALIDKVSEFNKLNIEAIEFYEKGKLLNIPNKYLEEWKFTGLNNLYFVKDRFWESTITEFEPDGSVKCVTCPETENVAFHE